MRLLVHSYPVWSNKPDEYHHTVTVWKEGDDYYQCSHPEESFDLESLPKPKPIPMEHFRGHWRPHLTECPNPIPADSFLKKPTILLPQLDTIATPNDPTSDQPIQGRTPRDDMDAEAEIYEVLKRHPHPNICVYYGVVRDGNSDHFTALCLKKYRCCLYDAILNGEPLDRSMILHGLSKGLEFLHSTLGLVHNDINPWNVMLDDACNPVIIDFDSCMPIAQDMKGRKAGTFGYSLEPLTISKPENDHYGVKMIGKFMEELRVLPDGVALDDRHLGLDISSTTVSSIGNRSRE